MTPLGASIRNPQCPEAKEISVAVTIQFTGSLVLVAQTFAESVEALT